MERTTVAICVVVMLSACAPTVPAANRDRLYAVRLDMPALVALDQAFSAQGETPLTVPEGCSIHGLIPAPRGSRLALEMRCAFGPAVVWLDPQGGEVRQAVTGSDSHLLAWAADGESAYFKVETVNRPRVVRVYLSGGQRDTEFPEYTYDIAANPDSPTVAYAVSQGMGLGSELWQADTAGKPVRRLAADAQKYISLARWSPDGQEIAFIKIPDTPTPFPVGELWIMKADGSDAKRLAEADAGHGYAPAWSPDGQEIAFVKRENPEDATADQAESALVSNLSLVDVNTKAEKRLTNFAQARVETPVWQPSGHTLAFIVVANDRMTAYVEDVESGSMTALNVGSACCVGWLTE